MSKAADLQASITLNVPPTTVMAAFQAIEEWSTWYPGVVGANWSQGLPWSLGAVMEVQVRNRLGMLVKSSAVVLPVRHQSGSGQAICWENRTPGLVTVCYAWAEAMETGSCFTLEKHYAGFAAPLIRLTKTRQRSMLHSALENLWGQVQ